MVRRKPGVVQEAQAMKERHLMHKFRRGFSDPMFEQGHDSEWDRALAAARAAIGSVLRDGYRDELTERQIQLITDECARRVVSALNSI